MADSSYSVEGRRAGESQKSRSYKKYVIIAAVIGIVLALVIILIGVLVGLRPSTQNIVHYSYQRDNTKEDMMSDPNMNMVQYHVTNMDYEVWLMNDFNRDIQVMKIKTAVSTNCFVSPLNRTTAKEPSQIKPPSNDTYMQNMTYVTYNSADTPTSDLAFMGKAARTTCDGISTYWLFPNCEAYDGFERRPKRWLPIFAIFIGLAQLGVGIGGIAK